MKTYAIPLTKPFFDEDERNEVEKVFQSGMVSKGPEVEIFEKTVQEYLGVTHAIAVSNCTSALHLSLLAKGIGPGDEVLVSDFTYPSTGHSVLYCGATPVFVDVDGETFNISTEDLGEKITKNTKAILPVHCFGNPAEMSEIKKISEEHGLAVIEDAACGLGATYRKQYTGTIGDIGCFSFHGRKGITTGEGGMVVTNDEDLAERIRRLSIFGIREGGFSEVGYNYKMSDITAAVGVAQMRKLEVILEQRRELAEIWNDQMSRMRNISAQCVEKGSQSSYQSYVAVVDKSINRDAVITKLGEEGIQCQIGTYALHREPVYATKTLCPHSAELFKTAIALPLYHTLSHEDISIVSTHLSEAMEGGK